MTDRYEKIRKALAMGPTPGPWVVRYDYVVQARSYEDGRLVPVAQPYGVNCDGTDLFANAHLIAACDPDTIRALLEERDALAANLAATEAARDGYRDDAHQLHAALVRMVAQYESEFDHEDTHRFRPEWLREALARTNAPQEWGEGWEIEPETLDAAIAAAPDLLEALQNIAEYWNQDQNEAAMADACWHAIHTARAAIARATGESK